MRIAIMQPTYLPWMGYFALYDSVDKFVVLEDVQFEYQSWQHRNRIKMPEKVAYVTVPIEKKTRKSPIGEVKISRNVDWRTKQLSQLKEAYRHAIYFEDLFTKMEEVLNRNHVFIAELNMDFIRALNGYLGIKNDKFVFSSSLNVTGVKVERLVNICRSLGAQDYVSPPGAFSYIDEDNQFDPAGIQVNYHNYEHPTYGQLHGPFVTHLSIIDLLMNKGPEGCEIMSSGLLPVKSHTEMKRYVTEHQNR